MGNLKRQSTRLIASSVGGHDQIPLERVSRMIRMERMMLSWMTACQDGTREDGRGLSRLIEAGHTPLTLFQSSSHCRGILYHLADGWAYRAR